MEITPQTVWTGPTPAPRDSAGMVVNFWITLQTLSRSPTGSSGLSVSCSRLDLGLVAVICLYATAVLTNIKAKMIGEFTLAQFGPTEFKTLLALYGIFMAVLVGSTSLSLRAENWARGFFSADSGWYSAVGNQSLDRRSAC